MAKPHPVEFRDDVVRAARKSQAPITQIARHFGIFEATLHNQLKRADIEDGSRAGLNATGRAELRSLKMQPRLLEPKNENLG